MKNKKITINLNVDKKRRRKGYKDIPETKNNSKREQYKKELSNSSENNSDYYEDTFDDSDVEYEYVDKEDIEHMSEGINIVNKYKEKVNDEREKRIGKTLKEVEEELKSEKEISNFKPVIFSIIIVSIIILLYVFLEYGPICGLKIKLSDEDSNDTKIDIVSSESDIYAMYNNELLVYSNQSIVTYNNTGKKTWSYNLEQMFTPKIYIQGKYMIITNNISGNIYMFENKKEILNKKIDGEIDNVYIDETGTFAVEYASNGYKKVIGLYDKSGKNIYNAYLKNDSIADIKILDNGQKILVTKINSSSFKANVEVEIVDSTKQEDNIKQIAKLDNNFVYDLTIQNQNIIMLLDSRLVNININTGEVKTIKEFDSSQILYFALSKNYFTSVEKNLNEDEYKINNVRFDGTSISSLNISNSPKILANSGLLNYFIYQDRYSIVNKWGIEIENKEISAIPKDIVIFNNEKSLALIYTNRIYIENI